MLIVLLKSNVNVKLHDVSVDVYPSKIIQQFSDSEREGSHSFTAHRRIKELVYYCFGQFSFKPIRRIPTLFAVFSSGFQIHTPISFQHKIKLHLDIMK